MTPEVRQARRPEEVSHQNGLEQAINRYKQSDFFMALSGNTRSVYAGDIAQFQRYCRAQDISEVRQIESENIRTWHDQLRQAGRAPATIERKRSSLSGFFNWAQAEGIIRPDLTISFPIFESAGKRHREILSAEQVDLLISKAKNLRDASLILIALETGASIAEIVNLNAEDILRTRDENTAIRFKGIVHRVQPRTLEIDKRSGDKITEYIKSSGLKPKNPLLIGFSRGHGRLTRAGTHFIIGGYGSDIGVENLNPRMLRDTFIANFTGTPDELDAILGRRNPEPARSAHSPKEIIEI